MTCRICFVCLGNICRSPTAEGVFRHLVAERKLDHAFAIESAGTAAYHVGHAPDKRSTKTAAARGITLEGTARRFEPDDFERFDLVLAMDRSNYGDLLARAPSDAAKAKVHMLRSFDPKAPAEAEVPDPYYGGPEGFDDVLQICLDACEGLLDQLVAKHGLR